ncbi:hypothetical protein E4U58_003029 [Claviceps cyperi]|nr:hypothetical protein E4U58_003029 [Claviceps cyperi]
MPTDVGKYLASKYLVAKPEILSKKRKRKSAPNGAGIIFSENDDWGSGRSVEQPDGNDETLPQLVHETTAEFRKTRKNNWKRLGTNNAADIDGVANTGIASAILEEKPRPVSNDELPVVANVPDAIEMGDGTHAGLQTAWAVSAQLERRTHEERAQFELHIRSAKENGTVYRDGSGRRVNLSTKRAEAKRIEADAADKETEVKQALRGKTQLEEAKKRTEQLKDARFIPFARTADDENLNEELKERARWDDPALHFRGECKHRVGKARQGSVARPFFTGAAPPNRYGIKPGYRWDGVDRGIGFEAGRFRAINRRDALRNLDYSWQLDE